MMSDYQAEWISKEKATSLRRAGALKDGILLDSIKGFIVVHPAGTRFGDEVLSREVADYELRPEWCTGSKPKLLEARKLLKLDGQEPNHRARPREETWSRSPNGNGSRRSS
jgi:hypothetical protein